MARHTYSIPDRKKRLTWSKNEDNYTPEAIAKAGHMFSDDTTARWRRQVGRFPNQPRVVLTPPRKAGFFDPFTIMCVIDGMLRTEPTVWAAGNAMSTHLKARYPWLLWNAHIAGRIMSELAGISDNLLGSPFEPDDPNRPRPVVHTMVNAVNLWAVDRSVESWLWLGAVRDWVGYMAEHFIKHTMATRQEPTRTPLIWEMLWQVPYGAAPPISLNSINRYLDFGNIENLDEWPDSAKAILYSPLSSLPKD